ncbi:trypsin-like peptidase domain-containing protein [Kitasatospora sp. NA04385]|uniref:P-loop NTPase n=1 Tax=Kitasatospora sp. NA04385 TaxID=2742135 RepID=UPI0015907E93|nr:serine protease [Kitasatospora sp. NA04385]QKW23850.1 trypsin-like peptidase domain-containing protein [Kitasatospora sp. NA04385]
MLKDRVVVVGGRGSRGSGYLVGPRLVLTSAHVVGTAATVPLKRPGTGREFRATVVWRGSPGGRDDAALLHVDDDGWTPPTSAGVRWGEFSTLRAGQPCEVMGTPDLVQYAGSPDGHALGERKGFVETAHLTGAVNPGDSSVGNRYLLDLTKTPPQWPGAGLPWAGLSGAALLSDGLLVGVVTSEAAFSGHGAIEAVPAYYLFRPEEGSAFRAALQEYGADSLRLEPVEFVPLTDPQSTDRNRSGDSPAALLRPEREVVPFHGRGELLEELVGWCVQPDTAVLLVHGPGGQGKTRLVRELVERLTSDPAHGRWTAVWAASGAPGEDGPDLAPLRETPRRVLVVLDYAEQRIGQLAKLLESLSGHRLPFKVVLIARTGGEWRERAKVRGEAVADQLGRAATVALPALVTDAGERPELYRQAAGAFAGQLRLLPGRGEVDWAGKAAALPPRDLGDLRYANPLTLHMTALADLLDAGDPPPDAPRSSPGGLVAAPVENPDDAEARLLLHEERYWNGVLAANGVPARNGVGPAGPTAEAFRDALAATVLLDTGDYARADAVLRRIRGLSDDARRGIVEKCLIAAYPPAGAAAGPWGAVQPDRVAERFAGRRVLEQPYLLSALSADLAPDDAERLLTVLTRAAHHRPLRAELAPRITELCTASPDVLALPAITAATHVEEAAPLTDALLRLLDSPHSDPERLASWAEVLPGSSYNLGPWAVRLLERSLEAPGGSGGDAVEELLSRSRTQRRLARWYSEVGDYARALSTVGDAVEALTAATALHGPGTPHGAALRSALAGCLNNRAVFQTRTGQWDQALASADLAVQGFELLERNSGLDQPEHLLTSLGTRATAYGDLGDLARSLADWTAVVERRREQAADGTEEAVVALALALNNLALSQRGWSRGEECLRTSREALALLRPLAGRRPDAHRHLLTKVLGTLANCLGDTGHPAEALEVSREVVALRRRLAEGRPAAYRGELAQSLNSLSIELSRAGLGREALAAVQEAVEHYEELAREQPGAYREPLAMTLNTWSNELSDAGAAERAVRAAERSVALYAELHRSHPGAFATDHAMALTTLALRLGNVDRGAEGLVLLEQAVLIYRSVPEPRPAGVQADFARCLNNIASAHRGAGRDAEALRAAEQGVAVSRVLAEAQPDSFDPLFARLVTTRVLCLHRLGRLEEAADAAEVAVAAAAPTAARPESADILDVLAAVLSLARRPEAAHAALRLVVDARRALERIDPERHRDGLLDSLDLLRNQLAAAGKSAEALEVAAEAVRLRRLESERQPTHDHRARLAAVLSDTSGLLAQLGRRPEAAGHVAEAVGLWESLPPAERDARMPAPALTALLHAVALWTDGESARALTLLREVAESFERMPASHPARCAGMAMSLGLLGSLSVEVDGAEAALPHLDRAVAAALAIEGLGSEAYEGIVADTFGSRAQVRTECEPPHPGAAADAERAVRLYRGMPAVEAAARAARAVGALAALGVARAQDGLAEQALADTAEALAAARRLDPPESDDHRSALAMALLGRARCRLLVGSGRAEAAACAGEAVGLLESLVEAAPALFSYALRRARALREAVERAPWRSAG